MLSHSFCLVDPLTSRFDALMLPDQAMMELLVQRFDSTFQAACKDTSGDFTDACTWSCTECDEDMTITRVNLPVLQSVEHHGLHLQGVLEVKYLSRSLQQFVVDFCDLEGTLCV